MNIKSSVIVEATIDKETGISIINIGFPPDKPLSVRESAHLLASGISMLIRSCDNGEMGIKSHELIKEVIDHIHSEYVNTESFSDANADPVMKVKKK
jgi:hypothetical protein